MATITDTITLVAPFADGTKGEAKLYHLAQFNFRHDPLAPALPLTATSNQPGFAVGIVNGLDVDIQAVSAGGATITISDGRDGVAPVTIVVMVTPAPDQSSLEIASSDAIRTR